MSRRHTGLPRTPSEVLLRSTLRLLQSEPPADRRACRVSLIADKLFGPPAPFASESDEVRLGFPDLLPSYHHKRAAVQARRIVSGVQRIEQEFLVAGHSVLSPRPNFQPCRWLQGDPLRPPRRQKTRRREPAGCLIYALRPSPRLANRGTDLFVQSVLIGDTGFAVVSSRSRPPPAAHRSWSGW